MPASAPHRTLLVTVLTAAALFAVGLWALDLQARQARDTTRKLNLEDLETALNRRLAIAGSLPPEDAPTWCGVLSDPQHQEIQADIERALRDTEAYTNPAKPFPADPRFDGSARDYVYWKTSPVSFELLAHLEADDNNSRPLDLEHCELRPTDAGGPARTRHNFGDVGGSVAGGYDYAIVSLQRTPL